MATNPNTIAVRSAVNRLLAGRHHHFYNDRRKSGYRRYKAVLVLDRASDYDPINDRAHALETELRAAGVPVHNVAVEYQQPFVIRNTVIRPALANVIVNVAE